MQKSTYAGEAGVEGSRSPSGPAKEVSTGGGVASARPSDAHVSSLSQQEWSARTKILAEF